MGRKCLFSWCKSLNGLHMFPRDAARARLWLRAVGWPSTTDTSRLYVCSKHFSRESFENWRMVDFGLVDYQCKLRLAIDAVPSPEDFSILSEVTYVCLKFKPDRFTCLLLNKHSLLKYLIFR